MNISEIERVTPNEMFKEGEEQSKRFIEEAIKILGILQIAGAVTNSVWSGNGIEWNFINFSLLITGFIFFFGESIILKTVSKNINKEEKKDANYIKYSIEAKIDEKAYHSERNERLKKMNKRYER